MDTTYRKSCTLTISIEALFNDIDVLAHAYSEVGGASEDLRRSDRIAVDTTDALSEHIMTRLCDHRASDIRQLFVRFIGSSTAPTTTTTPSSGSESTASTSSSSSGGTGSTSKVASTVSYVFTLLLPTEAEDDTLAPMADLVHDYIVNGALADWYAKIGSSNTELLNLRAKEDLARLKELIFHRPKP